MTLQLRLFEQLNPVRGAFKKSDFASIPEQPGVYWMTDGNGDLLYIGKAKNLRQRLRSYRAGEFDDRPLKIQRLLAKARRIQWTILESEAAALQTEARLIKALSPPCNTAGVPASKLIWFSIGEDGFSGLRVSRHFTRAEASAHASEGQKIFGPFRGIASLLLVQAALVRRLWSAAHQNADYPAPLLRKVVPQTNLIEFGSPLERGCALIETAAFLLGLTDALQPVLPVEEPQRFLQLLWRNDDLRLASFRAGRRRRLDSFASGPEPS